MAFSQQIRESLLVKCHRHCCLCHKPAGSKMEIHHIRFRAEGGDDSEDNGIPLCLDCHADVAAYNPRHPKGIRYTESELKRHRDQWFAICAASPWQRTLYTGFEVGAEAGDILDDDILKTLRVDDRHPAQRLTSQAMRQDRNFLNKFAQAVFATLRSPDEETRWKASYVVEELIL
jgi:hypothetical protein